MKNILLKGTVCLLLVVMMLMPVNSGLAGEHQKIRQVTIYRCTPNGIEEIKTEIAAGDSNYDRKVGKKCRELFENDGEMQQYVDEAAAVALKNPFQNATFCFINSSGKGIHMQIILKKWLFDAILDNVINFLNSMGLQDVADMLIQMIDALDLDNSSMDIVMRSRYWSTDSRTTIEPLTGEQVELNGKHKLIAMGFVGYVSYSHICRIGFAEYYGFALMVMWR